ncbi:MAG: ABC transporter permease subunit [Clostridiaceae bacterium]
MKIRKSWATLLLIFVVLYTVIIFMSNSLSDTSDLLRPSAINTGLQNFSLAYDQIKKITFAGTYKNILIAYDENNEKLWEFGTKGPIREMKVDADNRKLYAGCEDRNIYIIDIDSGKEVGQINVQRRVYSIDINRDGSLIAVTAGINAFKNNLILYDASGNQIFNQALESISRKVVFNSDNSKLILGNDRAELVLFDLKGNQLSKTKLNYEIVGLQSIEDSSLLAVLTKNTTYYLVNEEFSQIVSRTYYGEGMSLTASKNLKSISIGNKEGDFYVADRDGKLLYTKRLEASVTGIIYTDKKLIVTGFADYIHELDISKLENIVRIRALASILQVLVYTFPLLFVFLIIMTVDIFRKFAGRFFRALFKYRVAYLMLIPTFALLLVFNYYPVVIALARSFTDWNINQSSIKEINFIGFDNFVKMFTEGYFLIGLKNLLILIVTSFIKILTVPLFVAELVFLMRNDRAKYWFRFLFVLPMIVPGVVMTLMWNRIFDPAIGLLNNTLRLVGLESLERVWLGDPKTAIWAIVFMGFPFINAFAFLVYYGGLIDIPSSLFEAARADGSNGWWNFTRIHLPLIMPQIKMLIILTFISTVQDFSNILILTNGGPGTSTYVPGLELYFNATRFGQYGYACALGLVMFIAILGGTILNLKMKANAEYND